MSLKILITGKNGFIGKFLSEGLESDFDLHFITRKPQGNREYLFSDSFEDILKIFNSVKPNIVIHLAGIAHISNKVTDETYKRINIEYTKNLVEAANTQNLQQFIYFSTIKIFGDNVTFIDETTPIDLVDMYSETKFEAERVVLNGLSNKSLVLRLPLVYGEEVKGNLKLLERYANLPVPVFFPKSTGKRSVLSLQSLLEIILKLIELKINGVFNLSEDDRYSALDIVLIYKKRTSNKLIYIPVPKAIWWFFLRLLGRGNMYLKIFTPLDIDNSKIKQELGFEVITSNWVRKE